MGGTIRARVRRGLLEPLEKGQRNLAASVWNSTAHRATFTECYIGHFYGIAVIHQLDEKVWLGICASSAPGINHQ